MSGAMAVRPPGVWHALFSTPPKYAGMLPPLLSARPNTAILAVLAGAFIATLTGRLSTFGTADIRGALHAGFDEGAWITTMQSAGQMLIGPLAVWAGAVWGPRRVLMAALMLFAFCYFLAPFSPNLYWFLALQFLAGVGSGCFIPLTLGVVARCLPPYLISFGIAAYALNLEVSLNVSASLEGWFVDHLSWGWIYWQTLPLAALMAFCIWRAVPDQPVNREALAHPDIFGLAACGVGFAMIYAALDQGNRLDWLNSGLVTGLMLGGGLLVVAFLVHQAVSPHPWINLRFVLFTSVPLLILLVMILRTSLLGTSYIVPQFLIVVRGFRSIEVGPVLVWIFLPQLVMAPVVALMLRVLDSRMLASIGLVIIAIACWWAAGGLTADWGADAFLPSQLVQSIGQVIAMTSVVFTAILNFQPKDALSFGAALQVGRLLGGEIGSSFMATWTRVREQRASATIGWHVQTGAPDTVTRLAGLAHAVAARSPGGVDAMERASFLLSSSIRVQAYLQAFVDGFAVLALIIVAGLGILALLPAPPQGPASPLGLRRLFRLD